MGRRKAHIPIWQPRSTPEVRRQLAAGLRERVQLHTAEANLAAAYLAENDSSAAEFAETYVYRAQETRAAGGDHAAAEAAEQATLYWATAGQTRLAAAAGRSLPQWSAGEAIPCQQGLMLFEEPIATVPRHHDEPASPNVPVDGIMWSLCDDSLLVWWVSRATRHLEDRYRPIFAKRAVWPLNYFAVRVADAGHAKVADDGGRYALDLLNVLGALWLMIGQDRVSTATTITTSQGQTTTTPRDPSSQGPDESVIVIDVHRAQPAAREASPDRAQPVYRHRWWVEGHWRQQACGPNHSERRPIFIPPHVKGPDGMPFRQDPERVYLLRDTPS